MSRVGISAIDLLLVFGTVMGGIGFAMVAPPLAPLFLMVVCFVLASVAWRAS